MGVGGVPTAEVFMGDLSLGCTRLACVEDKVDWGFMVDGTDGIGLVIAGKVRHGAATSCISCKTN